MSNTSHNLPWERKAELLSHLAKKMKLSGYGTGFAFDGGIRSYMKCLADHQKSGRPIHRSNDWEGRRSVRRRTSWFQPGGEGSEFSSVIFVPSTPGSMLAKTLQRQEADNNQGRTHRFRIVEKAGVSVRNLLAKNYPWSVSKCGEDAFNAQHVLTQGFIAESLGLATPLLASSVEH